MQSFIHRVSTLAQQTGRAFPGGEDLALKLLRAPHAAAPRRRLAKAMVAWLRETTEPPPGLPGLVGEAITLAWQGLSDTERLESGLMPAYMRVLRQTQQHDALLQMLEQGYCRPEPDDAWLQTALAGLAWVARECPDGSNQRRVARLLSAWLAMPDSAAWLQGLPNASAQTLANALLKTGVLSGLAALLNHHLQALDPDQTARGLTALVQHLGGATVRDGAQQAVALHPRHPGLRLVLLQAMADCGASMADMAPLCQGVDLSHPSAEAFLSGVATWAFESGQAKVAQETLQALATLGPLPPANAAQWQHLSVKQGGGPVADASPLDLSALAAVQEALTPLADLLAIAPLHSSPYSAAALRARSAEALAHFEHTLAAQAALSWAQAEEAANTLWALANAGPLELRHWQGVFPFDFGPDLGCIDPLRASALCDAVLTHLLSLCQHQLRGLTGQIQEVLQIARWLCEARWALGQAPEALADIARLQAQLAPWGDWAWWALLERCALEAGDEASARNARQQLPLVAESETHTALEWDDWLGEQAAHQRLLCSDPALPGTWQIASPDGRVREAAFATLPCQLSSVAVRHVQVRHSHLLVSADGRYLLPHAWHRQMGAFPFPHPGLLSRGLRGATLRKPSQVDRVDEALLVVANMDATFHRNYYHWMVLTLPRIHWAMAQGLLDGRRLLLPAELSGWMFQSLHDIGLPQEALYLYRQDQTLELADALLLSPQEWASATQIEALRQTLWRAAGLDPTAPPPAQRLLYLTRQGEVRRPFAQEAAVAALATQLGFECVAPETLSVLAQVRLFAEARAIAGPPGAAFTNLMWAQASTKVLTLFKEDINGPTFLDLSFIRGQQHRWLQGQSLPGFEHTSVVTSPYAIDLALAERELRWAAT
ncbi:MAG: hypothetical protein C4K60_12495 [Ideonella sp. MAG2]|nr:MAG: hypothetical protein C4K60_12495 [Ideonella sp. MAG2]